MIHIVYVVGLFSLSLFFLFNFQFDSLQFYRKAPSLLCLNFMCSMPTLKAVTVAKIQATMLKTVKARKSGSTRNTVKKREFTWRHKRTFMIIYIRMDAFQLHTSFRRSKGCLSFRTTYKQRENHSRDFLRYYSVCLRKLWM